jgi:hypothetical protein
MDTIKTYDKIRQEAPAFLNFVQKAAASFQREDAA